VKVAIVHPKFDRSGGAERYALGLAEGLASRGHDVSLFGRRAVGVGAGLPFHRLPALPFGRAVKTWSFCAAASWVVDRRRYDVVQGFGKTTCQTVHRTGGGVHRAYLARTGSRRRTFYDRVVVGIEDALFSSPHLGAVLCPSRWVAEEVRAHYPQVEQRIDVIPNGVDTAAFRAEGREESRRALLGRLGIPEDAQVLLFAGTNFRLKGLDTTVAALARLPGAHLVVAGGDDPVPFRAQASQVDVGERVHFLGAVDDLAPLYRAADALVHLTRYDPFANVCLEALACGTPVVTTDCNGAADVLPAAAGAVVPAGDAEAAAAALAEMGGRAELARTAAREVALRNDLASHTARVEALYASVLRAQGREAPGSSCP